MRYMTNGERSALKGFITGSVACAGVWFFLDASETVRNAIGLCAFALGMAFVEIRAIDSARFRDYQYLYDRIDALEEQITKIKSGRNA